MPAAFGRINHAPDDLDGSAALIGASSMDSLAINASYPFSNVLDPDSTLVCRLDFDNDATLSEIGIGSAFSSADDKACRILAAFNLRIPASVGQVQMRLLSQNGSTVIKAGTVFDVADLIPLPDETDRYDVIDLLDADYDAARVDVLFYVDANAVDYVEVGYLWAGPAVLADGGIESGWQIGTEDMAESVISLGGAPAYGHGVKLRTMTASAKVQGYNTAYGDPADVSAPSLRDVFHRAGTSSEVVFILRSSSTHALQTLAMRGQLTSVPTIDHQGGGWFSCEFEAREVR